MADAHDAGQQPLPEEDHPPMLMLTVTVIIVTIFVAGSTVALMAGFNLYGSRELASKAVRDAQLVEMRQAASAANDDYAVIDASADRYQVPVRRAMEAVVSDPTLLAPQGPQVGAATTAPDAAAAAGQTDAQTDAQADSAGGSGS